MVHTLSLHSQLSAGVDSRSQSVLSCAVAPLLRPNRRCSHRPSQLVHKSSDTRAQLRPVHRHQRLAICRSSAGGAAPGGSSSRRQPSEDDGYCPPEIFDCVADSAKDGGVKLPDGGITKRTPPPTGGVPRVDWTASEHASADVTADLPTGTGKGNEATASRPNLLKPFHVALFLLVLGIGVLFLAALLFATADIDPKRACITVIRRLLKTVALRQVFGILGAMMFVRMGLEPIVKALRRVFNASVPWEKSSEFHILREVYRPMETLFIIAAFTTLAENFLPQLIAIPRAVVQNVVRSTLSLTFVIAAARVVFNVKGRMTREATWEMELKGDLTKQRRVEAVDKLLSVMTLIVASIFGLQAVGLDVNSVLAIGGVGGLAIGLAGREILENLFTGLIILSSSPFEVGEEVLFTPPSGPAVEGIVLDVGWYRTTIRSFEREIYAIPNSVFSRNVVLNVTRKGREWRIFEFIGLQVNDVSKAAGVVADMRKVFRQDTRIIQKLHRRVFIDKIMPEQVTIYISAYVEAANRDAFMAVKQDLLLAFVDCCNRNGARLSRKRTQVELVSDHYPAALTAGSGGSNGRESGSMATTTMEGRGIGVIPVMLPQGSPSDSSTPEEEEGEEDGNRSPSSGDGDSSGDKQQQQQQQQQQQKSSQAQQQKQQQQERARVAVNQIANAAAAAVGLESSNRRTSPKNTLITASYDDI